jgi:TRAP-type uncharacterized transport system fused permease subunit
MGISVSAVRLALMGFLVPFAFAYSPSLLLITEFSLLELCWVLVRLGIAMWMLAVMIGRGVWWAAAAVVGAVVLVLPWFWLQLAVVAALLACELPRRLIRRSPPRIAP